ncbi:hypothetical protein HYV81_06265 [Candidatus Woesearchaeota archaeon]|nr:hypothetical protein [Candidatus Woesearchaeota archaeon]
MAKKVVQQKREVSVSRKDVGLKVAGSLFGLIALIHLIRLFVRFDARIAGWHVPLWASSAFLVAAGALSLWFFLLARD